MFNNFRVYSLQRCGTHGICEWLIHQNKNLSEFKKLSHIEEDVWVREEPENYSIFINSSELHLNCIPDNKFNVMKKVISDRPNSNCDGVYLCHETGSLKDNKKIDDVRDIIILRDSYNCFASFINKYGEVPVHIVQQWEERAEEILFESKYLSEDAVFINFNKWFESQEYRQSICKELDLDFTDLGINNVSSFGGGSSFTGEYHDGNAQIMNVNYRYEQFLNNPRFIRHFPLGGKFRRYNKEIFGIEI